MNDSWFLEFLPAFATVVASLVGLFVALDQLGSVTQLRREATFWKEHLNVTELTYDHEVAQSLYRLANARLLALQAYPGWMMFLLILLGLLMPLSLFEAASYIYAQPHADLSVFTIISEILPVYFFPLLDYLRASR